MLEEARTVGSAASTRRAPRQLDVVQVRGKRSARVGVVKRPVEAAVSDIEPGVCQHIRLALEEVAGAILARRDRAVLGVDVVLVGRVALQGHRARQANVESAFRSVGPRGDEIDDLAGWAAGRWTVDQVDVTAVLRGGDKTSGRRGETGARAREDSRAP